MYQVIKRDGTVVNFDKEKVINAINAAFIEVDGLLYETDTAEDIAEEIEKHIANFYNRNLNLNNFSDLKSAVQAITKRYSVEDIQDLVEE